jgi:flagella basal body P-ring formation protein FlgA
VNADRITAGDLARQIPEFLQLDPTATVGLAPLPGARRVFSPRELTAIAGNGGQTAIIREPVCVERDVAPLTAEQIRAAIESALRPEQPHLEIVDFSHVQAPDGELVFPRSGFTLPPTSDAPVLWRGSLKYDGRRTISVWTKVRIFEIRKIVVAARRIRAGASISADDLALAERNVIPFTAPLDSINRAVGLMARKLIPEGGLLTEAVLQKGLDISTGETVRVDANVGSAQISFEAVARSSGRKGDRILLLNPESQRTFRAIVDDRGRAHVTTGT